MFRVWIPLSILVLLAAFVASCTNSSDPVVFDGPFLPPNPPSEGCTICEVVAEVTSEDSTMSWEPVIPDEEWEFSLTAEFYPPSGNVSVDITEIPGGRATCSWFEAIYHLEDWPDTVWPSIGTAAVFCDSLLGYGPYCYGYLTVEGYQMWGDPADDFEITEWTEDADGRIEWFVDLKSGHSRTSYDPNETAYLYVLFRSDQGQHAQGPTFMWHQGTYYDEYVYPCD